ncbi:alpha-L-rhamnosidase [Cohnella zeiphila]|uniref:alpha-L-rhamnosidase n=1 Tax=Cohnella zeiphila TaxID=2761120 RepID=A0A7X0SMN8_9BACL|nr:alpha-L-rhamnosidase [Cohnella zeiphila]MBB6731684.1 family 78 glycoside hydrolase catalytic domain [Cohnella zeiphila]
MNEFRVADVACEYRTNPLGLGTAAPRFGWRLVSDRRGTLQQAYRIVVAGADGRFESPVWDSGVRESDTSIQVEYAGPALQSRTRYTFRVKAWDTAGRESDWSDAASFETAMLGAGEWQASWITPNAAGIDPQAEAAFLLRKRFELKDGIVSARVYATAAGAYELYANGRRVSEDVLAPGWTSYQYRIQYQTYDVTDFLQAGANALGVHLGDGWYRGGMGFEGRNFRYGERRAALIQLHVRYDDGTEEIVVSDPSWRCRTSPVLYASIYHGESYDARLECGGWSEGGFEDADWTAAEALDLPMNVLVPQENVPTRVTETIRPVSAFVTPAGDHVLDMGQNMVGRVRMTVQAAAGTRIELRHAEVLDRDGNIYFGNLRPAKQTAVYTARGEGTETYAPRFTFMGFRYVKVEGYPGGAPPLDAFVGEVIHSDMEPTGSFVTSDERVNRLQSNILWGQRGNFVDVPTDCPQRDERLGWTGDAQVFISTALFNFHGGPFFTKWLRDLRAEQHPDGGVPFVVPDVAGGASSAAWGDAAVVCPWTVYQYYGDRRLLAEQYGSMKAWVDYIRAQGDDEFLWNTGFHFGDWLGLDAKEDSYVGATPRELIATAYYAYSSRLVRDAAKALGHREDEEKYGELHRQVVRAFREEFLTATGRVAAPTQTAHVLTLMFELADESVRPRVAKDLNDLIVENGYHLTTGFVGTPYLCFVLSNHGYHDTAVRLLLQDSYPGWLYSVSKGATTIWEHWDSIKPDGSFWSDDMNSFNHYAYGAIGDWLYRKVAGLDMDPAVPAFKRVRIAPQFGTKSLSFASAAHLSPYGRIESGWKVDGPRIEVMVTIPPNAAADIELKGATLSELSEGGRSWDAAEGIYSAAEHAGGVSLTVGSGSYSFRYENADLFRVVYSEQSVLCDVLNDEAAAEVLRKHLPHLFEGPMLKFMGTSTLKQIAENGLTRVSSGVMDAVLAELAAL